MLTFGILGLVALYVLFHGTNKQQQAEATLTKYWARHPHHTSTGAVADTTHKRVATAETTVNEVPATRFVWGDTRYPLFSGHGEQTAINYGNYVLNHNNRAQNRDEDIRRFGADYVQRWDQKDVQMGNVHADLSVLNVEEYCSRFKDDPDFSCQD